MQEFIQNYRNASVEHSRTLNYNSEKGIWSVSEIEIGTAEHVDVLYNANSKAFIHNHTINYKAHSMTDVISLAQINSSVPEMKTSFVISADGSIYALAIEDSSKAKQFYDIYNHEEKKDSLNYEYGKLMGKMFIVATYDIFSVHALAYMLEKYDTGMKIMRLEQNGYRSRHSEMTRNEDGLVTQAKLTKCK